MIRFASLLALGALHVAVGLLLIAPGPALAQSVVSPALDTSPGLLAYVLSTVATVLVAAVTWALKTYVGVTLGDKAQDDLHSAAVTGATLALNAAGLKAGEVSPADLTRIVSDAKAYIAASVPDALARLAPSESVLTGLITSKVALLAHGLMPTETVAPAVVAG